MNRIAARLPSALGRVSPTGVYGRSSRGEPYLGQTRSQPVPASADALCGGVPGDGGR